jgi:hypothetical protein
MKVINAKYDSKFLNYNYIRNYLDKKYKNHWGPIQMYEYIFQKLNVDGK